MKYYFRILFMVLIMAHIDTSAQTDLIYKAEYFFDTDTAVGKNGVLQINSPSDSISLSYNNINVPNSLSFGVHYIYIRTKSDTGQSWSMYESQQFYIQPRIDYVEYFYDLDPGIGNGTRINISSPSDSIYESISNISTAGLGSGSHYLYIRSHSEDGTWSQSQPQEFRIKSLISKAEYFYDVDPGAGNGTALYFTNPSDSVEKSITGISTSGLSIGQHRLYIRTYDTNGAWGMNEGQEFYISSTIVSGEYFFDTDPGVGNGAVVTFASSDSVAENISGINTTGLSSGVHQLFVRTKESDGKWSLYQNTDFYISESIISGEYFFDADPGPGNGIAFSITSSDSVNQIINNISTTGLSAGNHQISTRMRCNGGNWSLTETKDFYIKPRLVQIKYWIDTIPSYTQGTLIDIPQSQWNDSVVVSQNISIACLDTGKHYLYIATKDEIGYWSLPDKDTFRVIQGTNIVLSHYMPGPGPNGTPVRLAGSGGGGANYRFRDVTHNGSFGINNIFLMPNDSQVVFEIKDTCGNYDYDTVIAYPTPTNMATGGGSRQTTLSGFNQWVYLVDSANNIIAAINDKGQNLDSVFIEYMVNTGPIRKEITNNYFYLDRNWRIQAKNAPAAPVDLRLYWLNSEFDSLNANDQSIDSVQDCQMTKYSGPNQNLNLNDNTYGGNNAVVINPAFGTYIGDSTIGRFAAFTVNGFSEFYFGNGGGIPLPLNTITFDAHRQAHDVFIGWKISNESNISHYELEQSIGNNMWKVIHIQEAINNNSASYNHLDKDVFSETKARTLHYRIKQVDINGKFDYSDVREVKSETVLFNRISIWPNPVAEYLNINFDNIPISGYQVSIHDMLGKTIYSKNSSTNDTQIKTGSLPKGIYIITIKDSVTQYYQTFRFEKL